jgi:hypothetical protein
MASVSLSGMRFTCRNWLCPSTASVPTVCNPAVASSAGILVYFPTFDLMVDTSKDCHLAFKSLGRSALLDTLHYVQPHCTPSLYPSELASHIASKSPAVIEDDSSTSGGSDVLTWSYPQPKCPRPSSPPSSLLPLPFESPAMPAALDSVYAQLRSLAEMVSSLQHPTSTHPPRIDTPTTKPWSSPILASTMLREETISLLHQDGSSLPLVRPCDTANNSDTKTHWTAEELHCIWVALNFGITKLCFK